MSKEFGIYNQFDRIISSYIGISKEGKAFSGLFYGSLIGLLSNTLQLCK